MFRLFCLLTPVSSLLLCSIAAAQETSGVELATVETTADPLAVPENASADELFGFLRRVNRRPLIRFKSRDEMLDYYRRASHAKVRAANRLWRIGRKDAHLVAVVESKTDGLSTLGQLGDPEALAEVSEFLDKMSQHENPAVASTARRLRIQGVLRNWRGMSSEQKSGVIADLTTLLSADPQSLDNVRLASNVANILGDTEDGAMAVELLENLLPQLKDSQDPKIVEMLPKMQGLLRRLELPGNPMEVEGKTLAGEPFDWDAYRGKVVLVDYWATWCGPCNAELPNIKDHYAKYHEKGFDVVGISLDDSPEAAASFLNEREIPWTTLIGDGADASGWNHPMAVKYGVRGIPRAILVDQDGKVVHMHARGETLGNLLRELLGEPLAKQSTPEPSEAVASQP